jgi:hypothetical protein
LAGEHACLPNGGAASAVRTYDIPNENSWARSLHFLAAWFFVVTGVSYLLAGISATCAATSYRVRRS